LVRQSSALRLRKEEDMTQLTVKAYAELIGKNEKTVYKMIKKQTIDAVKEKGRYRVNVDKNLMKVIDRTQKALEEAKAVLTSIESTAVAVPQKQPTRKNAVKKPTAKRLKSVSKPKPLKKSVKKTVAKKPLKKSTTKKR
jgi:hypothetical protein